MGLLKHIILPLFALLDGVVAGINLAADHAMIAEDAGGMLEQWGRDPKSFPVTDIEIHLIHANGAALAVLCINNLAAIFVENAHYRGMACLLQVVFCAIDALDYIRFGMPVPAILVVVTLVGVVGLVVHAMEPGIFTKDKTAKTKAK